MFTFRSLLQYIDYVALCHLLTYTKGMYHSLIHNTKLQLTHTFITTTLSQHTKYIVRGSERILVNKESSLSCLFYPKKRESNTCLAKYRLTLLPFRVFESPFAKWVSTLYVGLETKSSKCSSFKLHVIITHLNSDIIIKRDIWKNEQHGTASHWCRQHIQSP